MADLGVAVERFGGDRDAMRSFASDGPDLLPYATIVNARRMGDEDLSLVSAVYEWQGAPLLFLIDEGSLEAKAADRIHRIRRLLAMRGDAPYLGVVAPGRLDVYRIALDDRRPDQARVDLGEDAGSSSLLIRLGNTRPDGRIADRGWISNVVLKLLTSAIDGLTASGVVSGEDAISLVGRALFTRFLADRHLLPVELAGTDDGGSLFDTASTAQATCAWLDQTFNGDLLPFSANVLDALPGEAFFTLGNIMRRAPDGQLFLGWEERWANLDFAHIPIGVLSQAYELYLRNHSPTQQRREGGFYTPRPIADLMVRAAMAGLARSGDAATARVLDPAAGAGVFLLTAFRELVAERWRKSDIRPNTADLRQILYQQITGFDVNEAALRFAALGLYLISIELDPEPKPVDKLRFDNIRGTVLHRLIPADPDAPVLGSLDPTVSEEHKGRYDLVIGNPPWASGTKLKNWSLVQKLVTDIAATRLPKGRGKPLLPNEVLDLPFVWRAMDWARPDGQIAFALHARLLFQQGEGMADARLAIFNALDVTSVINGVEIRRTRVWPEIDAPFCLLFAQNRTPGPGATFRMISPRLEDGLNNSGVMRIDAANAEPIATDQLSETPEALKALFRGSPIDLQLLERVRRAGLPTLDAYWRDQFGVSDRGRMRGSGNGYQRLRPSSRVRKNGDGQPGVDASYLHGLPELTIPALANLIEPRNLEPFRRARLHDPRAREQFVGPVLVVHKSPPVFSERINLGVCDTDLVYNESFYGYSLADHPDGKLIARYLHLVLGSRFALWYALMTSGEFGFEREVVEKATLDRIPIKPFGDLSDNDRAQIEQIFVAIAAGNADGWKRADAWVCALYGLKPRDLQAIEDTLRYNLPFADAQQAAQQEPDRETIDRFCATLTEEFNAWSDNDSVAIGVRSLSRPLLSPWQMLAVSGPATAATKPLPADVWHALERAADELAATELVIEEFSRLLAVARLAQGRYWSETQARLLARRLVWSYPHLFAVAAG